jgi:hypothetical protein
VRLTRLGAYALGRGAEPPIVERHGDAVMQIGQDLVITAGVGLSRADRLYLATFSREAAPDRFSLQWETLSTATAKGRAVQEIRAFLESRAGSPLPQSAEELLNEVEAGARSLKDAGLARLIECTDPQLASRLATHPRTRRLCFRAGASHIAVPTVHEKAFARALRKLALPWPATT